MTTALISSLLHNILFSNTKPYLHFKTRRQNFVFFYEHEWIDVWNLKVPKKISLSIHYALLYYDKTLFSSHTRDFLTYVSCHSVRHYTWAFISILHGAWFRIDFTINIKPEAHDSIAHIMSVARGGLKYNLRVWVEW